MIADYDVELIMVRLDLEQNLVTDGIETLPTLFRDLMTIPLKARICNTMGGKG